MKYASVCSGVEAASLAWEYLGWEPAWFSEIEPFPCAVLKERFPHVPNLGDMTKIKVENLENGDQRFTDGNGTVVDVPGGVDLLVGGTPCQGFSVAGKQGGLQDDRSVLCLTFCQLLADMRPRWFVWENVPGVFSTGGGEDFKAFIRKVNEVGYCCGWRVLDAQYTRVDGFPRAVPQRRRRVFVIGHFGNEWQYPAEVLFEPTSLPRNTPPRRIKGKGFTGNAERCVGTASRPWDNSGVNPTLNQCSAGSGTIGASNQELFGQKFNGLVMNSNDQAVFTTAMSIGNGQPAEASIMMEECCQTLNCMHDQQAVMCYENHAQDCRVKAITDGACVTLGSSNANSPSITGNNPIIQECFVKTSKPKFKGDCETYVDTGVAPTVNCFDQGDKRANELICESMPRGDSPLISSQAETGGNNLPLVQECYAIDSIASNSMKSSNPNSGFHKEDIAKTLDTTDPNPVKNQGGTVIVESVAIAENIIGRQVQNGGNGTGAQEEIAYTQNTSGVVGVAHKATVRRLLPVECERLMGFPDNWTRIPWKGKAEEDCPDGPRYKACGNSMCVNVMRWIGMRIEMIERRMKEK